MDYAANLALFLLEKTGSIWGRHSQKMTAAEQRALFGRYIGKGHIVIDGLNERLSNLVSADFGRDYDERNILNWSQL